jgi:hypothetical protein
MRWDGHFRNASFSGLSRRPGGELPAVLWVQGYVSAANFLLLNEYHNYVDMNSVQVAAILKLVVDHCKAHPNDKPISAIDKFIRVAKKVEVDEKEVFNPWPQ